MGRLATDPLDEPPPSNHGPVTATRLFRGISTSKEQRAKASQTNATFPQDLLHSTPLACEPTVSGRGSLQSPLSRSGSQPQWAPCGKVVCSSWERTQFERGKFEVGQSGRLSARQVGTGRPGIHRETPGTVLNRRTAEFKSVKTSFLAVFPECQTKNRLRDNFPGSGEDSVSGYGLPTPLQAHSASMNCRFDRFHPPGLAPPPSRYPLRFRSQPAATGHAAVVAPARFRAPP